MLIFLRPQWTTYEGQLKEGQENGEEEGNRENVKTLNVKTSSYNFLCLFITIIAKSKVKKLFCQF